MKYRHALQTSFQLFLLILAINFSVADSIAQVVIGHVDDFQNLSTSGWTEGGTSPNPPTIIPDGGPAGDGDAFLRNMSSGVDGAGGRWVMLNQQPAWRGNYTISGVSRLSFDIRNSGSQTMHMRIGFNGPGGTISSIAAINVMPDSTWQTLEFDIGPQFFIALMGGGNVDMTLAAVNEFRILSHSQPSYMGEVISATVDIDNIRALGTNNVYDAGREPWTIGPNPAQDYLILSAGAITINTTLHVSDHYGRSVYSTGITLPYTLDLASWSPGLYYVTLDNRTVTLVKTDR